jgi:predicted nicotinamide N-methyase
MMVSEQQLFAHQLYPCAVAIVRSLDAQHVPCGRRLLLELGAGPALLCIIAALNGARAVVATDCPDGERVHNTEANLRVDLPARVTARCRVLGHAWGGECAPLLAALRELRSEAGFGGFDLLTFSDLLYELEHGALLRTCDVCLSPEPCARLLVAFQPHDPQNLHRHSSPRPRGRRTSSSRAGCSASPRRPCSTRRLRLEAPRAPRARSRAAARRVAQHAVERALLGRRGRARCAARLSERGAHAWP